MSDGGRCPSGAPRPAEASLAESLGATVPRPPAACLHFLAHMQAFAFQSHSTDSSIYLPLTISDFLQLSCSVKGSTLSGFTDAAKQGDTLFLLCVVIFFPQTPLPQWVPHTFPLLPHPLLLSSSPHLPLYADLLPRCLTVSCDDTAVASDPSPHFRHILGSMWASTSQVCLRFRNTRGYCACVCVRVCARERLFLVTSITVSAEAALSLCPPLKLRK